MSETAKLKIGSIAWRDLTVKDAEDIQDFYCQVVGWEARPHDMGAYHDFDILRPGQEEAITGICHALDTNANIPPAWLIYIVVEDVDQSTRQCVALGGKVIDGPRMIGQSKFCAIQDPAGAVAALISQ